MQKHLVIDVVAIVISKPLKIGLYKDKKLFKEIIKEGLTSEILPEIFDEILNSYKINSITYSKGPGSFMAIKLSYIFFKTLQITNDIKLFGVNGFYFNNNKPIKAVGNSFFVKKEDIITLEKDKKEGEFFLPKTLKFDEFENEEPLYVIKAV